MNDLIDMTVAHPLWACEPTAGEIISGAITACRGQALPPTGCEEAEISVLLCDDLEIRRLNRQWRNKDSATNILSFPTPSGPARAHQLGDIAISYETVAREALEEQKPFADHLAHMAVHGYLHLIGYDHETSAEAEEMEAMERGLLATIGVPDPYRATEPASSLPSPALLRQPHKTASPKIP